MAASIVIINVVILFNFQKPERDLAIEVGVIDPPNTGGQTVQLHARERLLEQRAKAGEINCELVKL